jgi:hypothetical protein
MALPVPRPWQLRPGSAGLRADGDPARSTLPLLIAFGVAAFLVGRKDRVGLIATLLMVPACAVIALGSFGEALAPGSPNVPREVQVGGGILGGILFLALLGAAAWAAQARRRAHYFSHSSVAP